MQHASFPSVVSPSTFVSAPLSRAARFGEALRVAWAICLVLGLLLGLVLGGASGVAQAQNIYTAAGSGTGGYSGDGGAAIAGKLNNPFGVALDSSGNLYIADTSNNRIRKVDATTGLISTVAGTGTAGYNSDNIAATSANLNSPTDVALDSSGNLYIADTDLSLLMWTRKAKGDPPFGWYIWFQTPWASSSPEMNVSVWDCRRVRCNERFSAKRLDAWWGCRIGSCRSIRS